MDKSAGSDERDGSMLELVPTLVHAVKTRSRMKVRR